MKVAIDVSRMHKLNRYRGIGIYAKNLFIALKKYTNLNVELITEKKNLKEYDAVHVPFFDFFSHTLNANLPIPLVVTIHDLIPIMFPGNYPPGIRGRINWQFQKFELTKVKSIIAVSNTVKQDIIKILKIPSEKISVVYSAPSEKFHKISDKKLLDQVVKKYDLPGEFVLYVGNVNWNKNIIKMTEAVLKNGKKLVIVGSSFLDKSNLGHPEKKSLKYWLEKYSDNKEIKILGFINDSEIVKIMNSAKCLILPSFYEGFGLPILEAQACGIPVITSNVSATAEIAGKGAILVNPEKENEIEASVNDIFNSEKLSQEIIRLGAENLKRFSWEKTALETTKVYQKCTSLNI